MNYKQKLGYTALGAVIMLVGMVAGSIFSPPLVAQRGEVFGEIVCKKLTVVDDEGNKAIDLSTHESGNSVVIYDKAGSPDISLDVGTDNNLVIIRNKAGNPAIVLKVFEGWTSVEVWDEVGGLAIDLSASEEESKVAVPSKDGSVFLDSQPAIGSSVGVYYKGKGSIGLFTRETWNSIIVHDKAGNVQWEAP